MQTSDFIVLVSNRLNNIMKYKNLDVKKLSVISGISKSQIYKILSGNSDTTLVTLFNILKSLNVPFEKFFNFKLPIECLFGEISISELDMLKLVSTNLKIHQANLSRIKGLTQAKLADNLNQADYRYISYLFNGRNNKLINMKISTLYKISKELELENKIYLLFRIN